MTYNNVNIKRLQRGAMGAQRANSHVGGEVVLDCFVFETTMSKIPIGVVELWYKEFIKYCVFYENLKIYSGLWPLSVFHRCVHGRHNGR